MIFKPMPKEEILKALRGHEDIIDRAVKEHEAFFKRLSCPSCGGEVMPVVNPKRLFRESSVLPSYLGKCRSCGVEFEPYTGIQVTLR
jgi:RNase P subunit RPR2